MKRRSVCDYLLMYISEQVSVMSTFERRAMGIPMFAPSLDLITRWHMEYGLVFERRFSPFHQPLPARVRHWIAAHVVNGQTFTAGQVMNRASICLSYVPFVDDKRVRVHIGLAHANTRWQGGLANSQLASRLACAAAPRSL
jgi:hypothetical protein